MTLQNKTAILTGANGGIGLAVASSWLENGARCVLSDISPANDKTVELMKRYGAQQVHYLQGDVTEETFRSELVKATLKDFQSLDLLFNNAAIFDMAPLLDSDEAMYDRIFNVNVKAMFFMMTAAIEAIRNSSGSGAVINMASQAGRRGESLVSHYCASKAAVISYTQSAALAMASEQIRVNAISPGVIDTPMWDTVDSLFARHQNLAPGQKKQQVGEAVPLGRMGDPSDIVGAALFLAGPGSHYITGQTLNVDGGNVLS